jgi:hypothetical protein
MVDRNYIYIRDFHPSDAVLSAMDDKRFDLLQEQNDVWITELNQ